MKDPIDFLVINLSYVIPIRLIVIWLIPDV